MIGLHRNATEGESPPQRTSRYPTHRRGFHGTLILAGRRWPPAAGVIFLTA